MHLLLNILPKGDLLQETCHFEVRHSLVFIDFSASENLHRECLKKLAFEKWMGIQDSRATAEKYKSRLWVCHAF